jgi:hypothetical protein
MVKQLGQPGKILLEEITCSGVLVHRRYGMDANAAVAQGIVATRTTTNSNNTESSSTESDATNRGAS